MNGPAVTFPLQRIKRSVLDIKVVSQFTGPFPGGQLPGNVLRDVLAIGIDGQFFKSGLDRCGLTLHESLECKRTFPRIKRVFLHCGGRPVISVGRTVCTIALISAYRRPKPLLIASRPGYAIIIMIRRTGGLISLNSQVRKFQFDLAQVSPIERPFCHW